MVGFNKQFIGKESKAFKKADYVSLADRGWDGKVEALRPYKDHKWTGARFDSHLGILKSGKKHKGKMG
jgi:hypothetical protein